MNFFSNVFDDFYLYTQDLRSNICATTENNICCKKMLLLLFLFMWIAKDDSLAIKGTHLQVFRLAVNKSTNLLYPTFPSCAEMLFPAYSSFISQINVLYSVPGI